MKRQALQLVSSKPLPVPSIYESNPSLLDHARIPTLYRDAVVEESHSRHVYGYLQRLEHNLKHGYGLILSGTNGTGKTHLAAAVARAALKITPLVMFITAKDLIGSIIDKKFFDGDITILRAAETRDLLIADDLDKEYRGSGSGFAELNLENLLRIRVAHKRATIITTNRKPEDLELAYGPSISSLIAEACIGIVIKGPDKRKDIDRRRLRMVDAGVPE
jgi:DNA replication protein DnaC